jgi:hypothetical protein
MLPYHTTGASRPRFVLFNHNHKGPRSKRREHGYHLSLQALFISCLAVDLLGNEFAEGRICV